MAHKDRMLYKKERTRRLYEMNKPVHVEANLGQNHPDYGMSMEEHLAEKAKRNLEKSS
jgi:hypothetical protein